MLHNKLYLTLHFLNKVSRIFVLLFSNLSQFGFACKNFPILCPVLAWWGHCSHEHVLLSFRCGAHSIWMISFFLYTCTTLSICWPLCCPQPIWILSPLQGTWSRCCVSATDPWRASRHDLPAQVQGGSAVVFGGFVAILGHERVGLHDDCLAGTWWAQKWMPSLVFLRSSPPLRWHIKARGW